MELTTDITVEDSIKNGLKHGISYAEYRKEVEDFVANTATSGEAQTEALINYTMLNNRRMRRWDKTVKIHEEVKQKVSAFKRHVTWLVLTKSWCGDAAHMIPVMNKIAELSDYIELKLVYRDQHEALMNAFLTNGSKSIPKLIMIDELSGEVLDTYGPRPSKATQLVQEYKNAHGALTPEFKEDLQHWYNTDKGQNTIEDLLKLLDL